MKAILLLTTVVVLLGASLHAIPDADANPCVRMPGFCEDTGRDSSSKKKMTGA